MWQRTGTASLLQAPFCTTAAHLRGVFHFYRMSSQQRKFLYLGQALTLLLCYRRGFPLIKLFLTLQHLRVNKAHACADASVFTILQVSAGSVTPQRNWPSQKFGRFPSESHPVGLSFGKNLWCLFSTKLALPSLQRLFCFPAVWFGASVVTVVLAHLKSSLPQ